MSLSSRAGHKFATAFWITPGASCPFSSGFGGGQCLSFGTRTRPLKIVSVRRRRPDAQTHARTHERTSLQPIGQHLCRLCGHYDRVAADQLGSIGGRHYLWPPSQTITRCNAQSGVCGASLVSAGRDVVRAAPHFLENSFGVVVALVCYSRFGFCCPCWGLAGLSCEALFRAAEYSAREKAARLDTR